MTTRTTGGAMTDGQANAVFDVLMEVAGAPAAMRECFVQLQSDGHCREFRFQGSLGFGGKFWRSSGRWYVTAYPEDIRARPERQTVIDATNDQLAALLAAEAG